MAGAPVFAAMEPLQRAAAAVWCALGPAAALAGRLGGPRTADAFLIAYGRVTAPRG